MGPRPTRGTALSLIGAAVLLGLTRLSGVAWLALACGAMLALPLVSLVLRPGLAALAVSQRGPVRVAVGGELQQVLVVANRGRRVSPPVTWRQAAPGLSAAEVAVPPLAPGEVVELPLRRTAERRGEYRELVASLSTTAPFGALRWQLELRARSRLVVHPETGGASAPLRSGRGTRVEQVPVPVAGQGTEVLGLRPWRQGDSVRSVSARASARHGRPLVIEHEREDDDRPALAVLVAGGGTGPGWERQVSYAATTVLTALREARRVVLLSGEGGPEPPVRLDREGVLDFFAAVDRAGALPLEQTRAAVQAVHPGGTLLLLGSDPAGFDARHGDVGCCHVEVLRA